MLAGRDDRYDAVSSFFSEVFDLGLKVFGDLSDFDRLDSAGSVPDGDFVATYWEDGRLAGALTIGQSAETEERLKQLIAARAPLVGRRPQRVLAGSAS